MDILNQLHIVCLDVLITLAVFATVYVSCGKSRKAGGRSAITPSMKSQLTTQTEADTQTQQGKKTEDNNEDLAKGLPEERGPDGYELFGPSQAASKDSGIKKSSTKKRESRKGALGEQQALEPQKTQTLSFEKESEEATQKSLADDQERVAVTQGSVVISREQLVVAKRARVVGRERQAGTQRSTVADLKQLAETQETVVVDETPISVTQD